VPPMLGVLMVLDLAAMLGVVAVAVVVRYLSAVQRQERHSKKTAHDGAGRLAM